MKNNHDDDAPDLDPGVVQINDNIIHDAAKDASVSNLHLMQTIAKAEILKPNTKYVLFATKTFIDISKTVDASMKHLSWNKPV